MKFHEKPSSANRVVECGETDTTKLIVVSSNFANASKHNTANCVLHDVVHRGISRRSFPFKMFSHYARKCTLNKAHNRNTAFPVPHFHGTGQRATALCADLLYQISSKSNNTCGKYGQKWIEYGFHYRDFI